eukprot:2832582-Rhodomonas_salina.1
MVKENLSVSNFHSAMSIWPRTILGVSSRNPTTQESEPERARQDPDNIANAWSQKRLWLTVIPRSRSALSLSSTHAYLNEPLPADPPRERHALALAEGQNARLSRPSRRAIAARTQGASQDI